MSDENLRRYLISNILDKLVEYTIEDEQCTLTEAMKKVYESPVIRWLENPQDNLRSQSPAYIYELLKRNLSALS